MKELMKKLKLSRVGVYKRIDKIKNDFKIIDVETGAYCLAFQNNIKISKKKYNIDKGKIMEVESALRSKGAPVMQESVGKRKLSDSTLRRKNKKLTQKQINLAKDYLDTNEAKKALAVIKKSNTIQLSQFKIIGNYVRYDEKTINDLKNLKQKITHGINPKTKGDSNFLIWGFPGSGKTYLVEQIAKSLKNVEYYELNLAKVTEKQFKLKLGEIEKAKKNCICLIDEVDSDSSAKWVYEYLLTHLSPLSDRKFRICFISAGSGGATIDEMRKKIRSKNKGNDFLSRIPTANHHVIPITNVGDRLLVTASQLLDRSKKLSDYEIKLIDKLALFYILVNPQLSYPRQIGQFLDVAIEKVKWGDDRLKYDQLFEYGDLVNKEFWLEAQKFDPNLFNSFIHIEN